MNRTMLRTGLLIFVVVGGYSDASSWSLRQQPTPPTTTPPPAGTRPEVIAWLDCVECGAELKQIAARGDQVVPDLRAILLSGPSKDRLDRQQQHLKKTYLALKEYERQHPQQKVPLSEGEYVQLYEQKYILLNRTRAARGLGAIGTPLAKGALTDALKTDLPQELRRDIEVALKTGVQ
jgi:hypothetical protein